MILIHFHIVVDSKDFRHSVLSGLSVSEFIRLSLSCSPFMSPMPLSPKSSLINVTTEAKPFKISVRDFPGCPVVKNSPSNSGGAGLTLGLGVPQGQKQKKKQKNIKQKECCNKFNKNFKNDPHQLKSLKISLISVRIQQSLTCTLLCLHFSYFLPLPKFIHGTKER